MSNPTVSFTIADIFSTTPFRGNPLAIVNNTQNALTTTQMRLLTRQFNLSETTFFSPPSQAFPTATYRLRSFLPDGREVFGAGHNILGVWWHLAAAGFLKFSRPGSTNDGKGVEEYIFHQELGHQLLPVKIFREKTGGFKVSIRQSPPKFHGFHPDPDSLARSIGIETSDIGFLSRKVGEGLKPQVLSTSSTHHLFVPISSVEALNRISVDREKLLQQLRAVNENAYGLYLFTPQSESANEKGVKTYQARFFSPGMSGEDPATGSAAGPLSAYLYCHGELELDDGVGRIRVVQGLSVGRECFIDVRISKQDGEEGLEVDFEGGGVEVAKGDIAIPGVDVEF